MINQRTIQRETSFTGLGLHSGRKVTLTLKPAPVDFGIQFKRTDFPGSPTLKAFAETVSATENNTTLGTHPHTIHTVEHLLSVFYGLGVNNCLCEVDGPEIPIMDGSGASFVFLLKETGIVAQNKTKSFLVMLKPIKIQVQEKWAMVRPNKRLTIDSTINFTHPLIKTQKKVFEFSCESFIQEIARARTFGLYRDVDMLQRKGLIKGGSLDNAIVLDDYKVMNPDGLRYSDEFIRHKILDTLGDLALLGHELVGSVTTYMSGHKIHNLLCREILANPESYEIVSANDLQQEELKVFNLPTLIGQSIHQKLA